MKGNFEDYFDFEETEDFTIIDSFKSPRTAFQSMPNFRGHDIISFSENIFEIPQAKFAHSRLKSVYIPFSIEKICANAFSECRLLRILQFDNGISYIGNSAFSHTPVSQVFFPDSLEKIDSSAFKDCNKLSAIVFGSGLLEIGSYAFYGTDILALSLPPSLCKIGISAFENCKKLKEITFENTSFEADYNQILNILNNSTFEEQIYFSKLILNYCENYIPFLLKNIEFSIKCEIIEEFNSILNIISSDFSIDIEETKSLIKVLYEKDFLISEDFDVLSELCIEYKKSNLNELFFTLKNKFFPEKADISEMFKL